MFAYSVERSKFGVYGFDRLNFFTNDEVYYTSFEPNEFEIRLVGKFIKELNELFFSTEPIRLCLNKVGGKYIGDVKIINSLKLISVSSGEPTLGLLIADLRRKLLIS